ncbi:MAG: 4Fe-4S dicluster domain-containing protein [Anaerolineae bacterium]|nr:4Fe-4S dicluster domain-containing protein [Anaerolineae bacterium]
MSHRSPVGQIANLPNEILDETFADQVRAFPGGEKITYCFSCGTCTATCPIKWVEENYNPRRIIRMVMLGMRDEVLSSPFIWLCSACDICYRRCPQDVRISDLMKAIRSVAIREGYAPVRAVAQVNERACAGCGMCAQACPYEAIELTPRWVTIQQTLRQRRVLPKVDKFLCQGCSICTTTCPVSAISVTDIGDDTIVAQIRGFAEETGNNER